MLSQRVILLLLLYNSKGVWDDFSLQIGLSCYVLSLVFYCFPGVFLLPLTVHRDSSSLFVMLWFSTMNEGFIMIKKKKVNPTSK